MTIHAPGCSPAIGGGTGESRPSHRAFGDLSHAGAHNVTSLKSVHEPERLDVSAGLIPHLRAL